MSFFSYVALRDGSPFGWAASRRHSSYTKRWAQFGRWAALILAVVATGKVGTTPALAASASPHAGTISFYADILGTYGTQKPFLVSSDMLAVRPTEIFLTNNGTVVLGDLKWSGWGTSVARATGVWSANGCDPDCADGKWTKRPGRLTLSSPGVVLGRRVYRCFQVDPPDKKDDVIDHGCLHLDGGTYDYFDASTFQ